MDNNILARLAVLLAPKAVTATDPALARNQSYVKANAGGYTTALSPDDEKKFQAWVAKNKVPFDPSPKADYDMRGFYAALQAGDPIAKTAVNPNDKRLHFPDYWKTPYHKSFSNESKFANPATAPKWNAQDQLVDPATGAVVFDERAKPPLGDRLIP